MPQARRTIAALLIAALGVIIQIIAGAPYPPVPPVFFILLLPAAIMFFLRRKWVAIPVIVVGLFLTLGLFSSGAWHRLLPNINMLDSVGLWIQGIAVIVALTFAVLATIRLYSKQS